MRLSFITTAFLGLAAFGDLASGDNFNLSLYGAPRHNLDGVLPVLDIEEQYIRGQTDGSSSAFGEAVLQCSASSPCPDGSCCNSQGHCGYRDEHCNDSCVANCDAKAPCGVNSENGQLSCPLNVCCSHFGFCGASEAFCRDTTESGMSTPCQKGFGKCGVVTTKATPTCGKDSGTASRKVAYYEGWNTRRRPCDKVWPSNIDTAGLTHLIFSFATIDPATFAVTPMHPDDEKLYADFLDLSDGSQKWIGIGGWEFSDASATRTTWSDMASSKTNRDAFIASLLDFLEKWDFAGVDIDWEWPGAETRGGNAAIDKQNQVDLMNELREALGPRGLSTVVPAQWSYLQHLDPKAIESSVDFITILAYDLHGPWDATIPGLGPLVKPHTDLKEIDTALDLFWFNDVTPAKINLGIANYGRGYTLADSTCAEYGCTWTGPSRAGECTELSGVLSQCEIQRIIARKQLKPEIIGGGAGVKQIVFDGQWVGYDDNETLGLKTELANNRCLGGTALWAVDYASCNGGGPSGPGPQLSSVVVPSLPAPSVSIAPSDVSSNLGWPSVPAPSSTPASSTTAELATSSEQRTSVSAASSTTLASSEADSKPTSPGSSSIWIPAPSSQAVFSTTDVIISIPPSSTSGVFVEPSMPMASSAPTNPETEQPSTATSTDFAASSGMGPSVSGASSTIMAPSDVTSAQWPSRATSAWMSGQSSQAETSQAEVTTSGTQIGSSEIAPTANPIVSSLDSSVPTAPAETASQIVSSASKSVPLSTSGLASSVPVTVSTPRQSESALPSTTLGLSGSASTLQSSEAPTTWTLTQSSQIVSSYVDATSSGISQSQSPGTSTPPFGESSQVVSSKPMSTPSMTSEVQSSHVTSTTIPSDSPLGSSALESSASPTSNSEFSTTASTPGSSAAWSSSKPQSTDPSMTSSVASTPASSVASSAGWSSHDSLDSSAEQVSTSDNTRTTSETSATISSGTAISSGVESTQPTSTPSSLESFDSSWTSSTSPTTESASSNSWSTSQSLVQSTPAETSRLDSSSAWPSSNTGKTSSGTLQVVSSTSAELTKASSAMWGESSSGWSSGSAGVSSGDPPSTQPSAASSTAPSSDNVNNSPSSSASWAASSVSGVLSQSGIQTTAPTGTSTGQNSWSQSSRDAFNSATTSAPSWSATSSFDGTLNPTLSTNLMTSGTSPTLQGSSTLASSAAMSSGEQSGSNTVPSSSDPTSGLSQTQSQDGTNTDGGSKPTQSTSPGDGPTSTKDPGSSGSTTSAAPTTSNAFSTPALSQTSSPVPTGAFIKICPKCSDFSWCNPLVNKAIDELPTFPPKECLDNEWCVDCWPKPVEYKPEICPWQCYLLDWCRPLCVPFDEHPEDIPPPGIKLKWFTTWWWGTRAKGCVPNDCKAECAAWYGLTLAVFKRPFCPCVPRTCTKGEKEENKKKKKCKLFGCGCGWMGLPFGPGCPGVDIKIKWPELFPHGIFGPDPCIWFGGCKPGPPPPPPPPPPGTDDKEWSDEGCGPLGCKGYCYSEGGCDQCPPEICKGPKCTRIGGCGPRTGPDPTPDPTRKPNPNCEEKDKTTVTERIVSCFVDLKLEPTTISSINYTQTETLTSACVSFEATYTGCGILGMTTTTTVSSLTTTSSEAPVCSRAPLDLNNDEGDNEQPPRTTDGPTCSRAPLSLDDDEGDNEHPTSTEGPSCTRAPLSLDDDEGDNEQPTETEGPSCTRAPLVLDDDEGDNEQPTETEGPSCTRAPLLLDDDEGDNSQPTSSEAPACTRAPLSLDDDEGNNEMPSEMLSSLLSSIHSNSTMFSSMPTPTSNASVPMSSFFNSTSRVLPPSTLSMSTTLPWGTGIPSGTPVNTSSSISFTISSDSSSISRVLPPSTLSMSTTPPWGTGIPSGTPVNTSSSISSTISSDSSSGTPKPNCPTCDLVFANCVKESCKEDGSDAEQCAKLCLSDLCYGDHEADYCKRGPCKPAACPKENPGDLYKGEPSIPFTTVLSFPGTTLTVTATPTYSSLSLSHSPTPTCDSGHTIAPGGKWTALVEHEIKDNPTNATFSWTLWDEHGCKAGEGASSNQFLGHNISTDIGAAERTQDYRMGYMLQTNVTESTSSSKSEIEFRMSKPVDACTEMCWVKWKINSRDASQSWQISDDCAQQCGSPKLSISDVSCDDDINRWHDSDDSSVHKRGGYCTWRMPFKPKNNDAPPLPPPPGPWTRDGRWTLEITQWMEYEESSLEYWLKDPNGILVKNVFWDTSKETDGATKLIETNEHDASKLRYRMLLTLNGLRKKEDSTLRITYQNELFPTKRKEGCGKCAGYRNCPYQMPECAPFYQTESDDEKQQSLYEDCSFWNSLDRTKHGCCDKALFKNNLEFSCDKVPDAYYPKGAGFERHFKCWWPHDFVEPYGNQEQARQVYRPDQQIWSPGDRTAEILPTMIGG